MAELVQPPNDRRYTDQHEWAKQDGDVITVGITDYAAGEMGDVVYVVLPTAGTTVKRSEKFGEVESVKAVSDLFSPVSGEVVEVNGALVDQPEAVNQSPFSDGWMIRVRPNTANPLDGLLDGAAYFAFLEADAGTGGGH